MIRRIRLINWSSLVHRTSLVYRSSLVHRSSLIHRSSLVYRSRLVHRSSVVSRSSIIVRFPRVSNISYISTVSISNIIVDSLCTPIRQSYTVGARGRIAITTFSGLEVSTRVVIIDSILILVDSRLIIGGRGLIYRGSMVSRGMVSTCKGKGGDHEDGLHIVS